MFCWLRCFISQTMHFLSHDFKFANTAASIASGISSIWASIAVSYRLDFQKPHKEKSVGVMSGLLGANVGSPL